MAGQREQYRGVYLQTIDGKSRVAIPAAFRSAIETNATAKTILLTPLSNHACLSAYDTGWSSSMRTDLQGEKAAAVTAREAFDMDMKSIDAVGGIDELNYDASGRFILPGFPRKKAKLGDLALFVGAMDKFQIWDPQTFIDAPEIPDHLKERVEYMLAERGSA